MTKRKLIQKTFPGIIILLPLLCQLISCSKDGQNNDNSQIFQVNLTDTTYHDLLHKNGTAILYGPNLIVANSGLNYAAADRQCPVCGVNDVAYVPGFNITITSQYRWRCNNCLSGWDQLGNQFSAIAPVLLKIYIVTLSGNILTIHL